jgi:cellulose synthase/poly-beta-1,6-N-acetylglucosamine synthase-like glycosyltransferase
MTLLFASIGSGLILFALAVRTHVLRGRAPALLKSNESQLPTTILLPVRNEELNIQSCLESILRQTVGVTVRVIDDGSTDRTREIVDEMAKRDPRISLLTAGPLPQGWRGKLHALNAGSKGLITPWILTTDADTRHAPDLLASAHATATKWQLDALSVAGFQEVDGLGESLLIPAVFALLDFILGDWRLAANSQITVANGQFILLSRKALEKVGGFESIRHEPIDDVALAKQLVSHGFRTGFFRGPELLRIRMYRGLGETFRGWRRNLGGLFGGRLALTSSVISVLIGPPLLLVSAALTGNWWAGFSLWGFGVATSFLFRRGSGHSVVPALLYPLDALLLGTVIVVGVSDHSRGRLASWKGREISLLEGSQNI